MSRPSQHCKLFTNGPSQSKVSYTTAWVVKHCRICLVNRPGSSRPPLEPIIVHNVFERVQLDLIDMRLEKDRIYEWILHIKDHFSIRVLNK